MHGAFTEDARDGCIGCRLGGPDDPRLIQCKFCEGWWHQQCTGGVVWSHEPPDWACQLCESSLRAAVLQPDYTIAKALHRPS